MISEEEYDKNSTIYEILLKKIAKTFESLEIDAEYEFMKNNRNLIFQFIDKLYSSLIEKQQIISICLDENSLIFPNDKKPINNFSFFFKFIDFSKAKSEVLPFQVPVWIRYIDDEDLKYFENGIKSVIEEIDGVSYVKKIASRTKYEINFIIFVIYNLIISDCVSMVDIFQFTNIYKATALLKTYYRKNFCDEFINFCKINLNLFNNRMRYKTLLESYMDDVDINGFDSEYFLSNELNDQFLFSLFCELTNSADVTEFLSKVRADGVIIPLFIGYGVYKKIIRRVHIYGYIKKENKDNKDEGSSEYFLYKVNY
jgi:hypothetical protein